MGTRQSNTEIACTLIKKRNRLLGLNIRCQSGTLYLEIGEKTIGVEEHLPQIRTIPKQICLVFTSSEKAREEISSTVPRNRKGN